MTPDEWEARLTATTEQWMLRVYTLSIAFNEGGVPKKDRRKVKEYLNWSLSRRVYNADHARELYAQWLDRLQLVEDQRSV
jgi:hypothetical protein